MVSSDALLPFHVVGGGACSNFVAASVVNLFNLRIALAISVCGHSIVFGLSEQLCGSSLSLQ